MAYNNPNWCMFFVIGPVICGIAAFVLQDPSRYCTDFLDCSRWASLFLLPLLLFLFLKKRGRLIPPRKVVPERKHDVFVSFRGADVRSTFLSHLVKALLEKKIDTFVDDKLRQGDAISPTLIRAIQESEISLVVLSENYANSKWCLEELAQIVECMEKYEQIVIPLFYRIDPSIARHQRGAFRDAFGKHKTRYDTAKLQEWRSALKKVTNLSGFHSSNHKTDADLIEKVVERALTKLNLTWDLSDQNGVVGMSDHIAHIKALISKNSKDVFIIGIWGKGGIGKTSIAEVLFDRLCHEYEGSEFLHVREELEKNGIRKLKNKLLSNLLDDAVRNNKRRFVKRRLRRKKVLVVLDDINDPKQLKILTGGHEWFGSGSLIIATSREKHVLSRDCDELYKVKPLNYPSRYMLFIMGWIAASIPFVLRDPSRFCTSFLDCSRWASLILLPLPLLLILKERGTYYPPPDLSLSASNVVPERENYPPPPSLTASNVDHERKNDVIVPESKYDVFISFRGADTRYRFLGHLVKALFEKKIDTFVDAPPLKGDEMSTTIISAIRESRISLVVFSQGYAHSTWCLEELVQIIECMEHHKQIVIPVFYQIDPSMVRHQTGSYKDAFVKHEMRFPHDKAKLQKWRSALEKASNLSGFHFSNHSTEAELIEKVVEVVEDVLTKLNETWVQSDLNGLIGMSDPIKDIEALMSKRSRDVFIIGIWGIGGIGKTTIAKVLFDRLCHDYEGSEILHVREELDKNGITKLKSKLVSKLLDDDLLIVRHNDVPSDAKMRLRQGKFLVVLDDINHGKQLEILTGGHDWYGRGSVIIVTSRDKNLFSSDCDKVYEVKPLNPAYALRLYILNAFPRDSEEKKKHCSALSGYVVRCTNCIPLAIKVLGSFLYDKNKNEWESELKKLEEMPPPKIQNILKLSYGGLNDEQKEIFLKLASCPGQESKEQILLLLDAYGYRTETGLGVLQNKALVTISDEGHISMHELIRNMGQEIVLEESLRIMKNNDNMT